MRRSQRLRKYKDVADKVESLDKKSKSITDDRNDKPQIKIFEEKMYNGSKNNEISLSQLFKNISDVQSIDVTNGILNNNSKIYADVQEVNTKNKNTAKESKSRKRIQNDRCAAAPSSTTIKRGSKRSRSGTSQHKINRQNKKRCSEAISNEFEVKPPIISVDNYFNPIRNPLMQVEANAQTRLNNDFYYYNANIPIVNVKSNSLLPPIYPNHFFNQTHTNNSINSQQLQSFAAIDTNFPPEIHYPTPELTQSFDFDSSTSTISLPESLKELFGCDDIREVLKLDKVVFRMRLLHLQTLAFVLNIDFDYLHNLVEKIMKLDTETLQKVIFAFQPEANLKNNAVTNKLINQQ